MFKWLKRKLNISCEFEENCAYNGKGRCKEDHLRYKEGLIYQGGQQSIFEKHMDFINNLDLDKVYDISFEAGLIWIHTSKHGSKSGMGMYLSSAMKDKLIMALWEKCYGTDLAGKILFHMMNRKQRMELPIPG